MGFQYTKLKVGNLLYRHAFPLYKFSYHWFKRNADKSEIALLHSLVRKGMVVYDIGANIGFYTVLLSDLVGDTGKVICFEPDARNFTHLTAAVQNRANIVAVPKAVSDHDGTLTIYRSKLLNVDHRTYPVNNYESAAEIEAVSIDGLLRQRTIPAPDLVKIDIQGYEMAAFKGMETLLRDRRDLQIVAEFWPHGLRRAGTSAVDFFDFVTTCGYAVSVIEPTALMPLDRAFVERNNGQAFEFSYNVLIRKTQR